MLARAVHGWSRLRTVSPFSQHLAPSFTPLPLVIQPQRQQRLQQWQRQRQQLLQPRSQTRDQHTIQQQQQQQQQQPRSQTRDQRVLHSGAPISNRNNLKTLRFSTSSLSEVDNGSVSEAPFLEELSGRIPHLPTASSVGIRVGENEGSVAATTSTTIDASDEGGFVLGTDDAAREETMVLNAILAHRKFEAVRACDSSVADKGSDASKLLRSFLNECAKIAAYYRPFDAVDHPRYKAFYSRCFEELWAHLPNLQKLHDEGRKTCVGEPVYSFKSGCRRRYRVYFRYLVCKGGERHGDERTDIPTNEHATALRHILAHPKFKAVLQVRDSSVADKGSDAYKLLNSFLYECAKFTIYYCPFDTADRPRFKAYYSRCFEELWSHLLNLQELHDKGHKISIGKSVCSLKAGCRLKYRAMICSPNAIPSLKLSQWCQTETTPPKASVPFSPHPGGSSEFDEILLAKTFPRHREDLIDVQNAETVEKELRAAVKKYRQEEGAVKSSKWEEAFEIFSRNQDWCRQSLEEAAVSGYVTSLPLRRHTVGWSAMRILSYGVCLLENRKDFYAAVELLNVLLAQCVFCPEERGKWFGRLTINLHRHLRRPEEAWNKCLEGLEDDDVSDGGKLRLWMRMGKIAAGDGKEKRFNLEDVPENLRVSCRKAPERKIEATLVSGMSRWGVKAYYLSPASAAAATPTSTLPTTTPVRVEEYTLRYYKEKLGFTEGLHCEGSMFSALFLLLFWEVIFKPEVTDSYRNSCFGTRRTPSALRRWELYTFRKKEVEERIEWIFQAPPKDLIGVVRTMWEKHEGTRVNGMSWERFKTAEFLVGFVESLDSRAGVYLSVICGRLARGYSSDGMPDLCVWNPRDKKWLLIEVKVKGRNQSLTPEQLSWLDYFVKNEIPCEVARVIATPNEKLESA